MALSERFRAPIDLLNSPTLMNLLLSQSKTDEQTLFRTDHLTADLKGRSVRGGAVTLSSQVIKFALQMGSTTVLARLLTPGDFGLVAMVTAVTGLARVFQDGGLSMATIQRAEIDHAQVNSLFWINVMIGSVLACLTAASAPAIAWFYNEPKLLPIALALGSTFIIAGFGVQHQALLRRQMRFRSLAGIEIGAMVVSIAVAVVSAWSGMGPWALVLMSTTQTLAGCTLSWAFTSWRPGWPRLATEIGPMLAFGAGLSFAKFFNYAREQVPLVMIGHSFGSSSLALYERAYRLLLLPVSQMMPPISSVAIPLLSRVQGDGEKLRAYARSLFELSATVTLPLSVVALLASNEVVRVVLGPQWMRTASIFAWLAPMAATQGISSVALWVLSVTGRSGPVLRLSVGNTVTAVASVALGLYYNLETAAAFFSITGFVIRTPLLFMVLVKHTAVHVLMHKGHEFR